LVAARKCHEIHNWWNNRKGKRGIKNEKRKGER
jgi:hypothetical protein